MIVLLDIENQTISVYDKKEEISFNQAEERFGYANEDVYYVTNAVETDTNEIVNLIRSTGISPPQQQIIPETGHKYLRGTTEGTIYVGSLKFEGMFDLKLIDEEMKQTIRATPDLQQLISNKKIEIVGENTRRKIMKDFKQSQNKQLEKQKLIDKSLDTIILKDKVDPSNPVIVDNAPIEAEEINILTGGSAVEGGSVNTMSELMNQIESFE